MSRETPSGVLKKALNAESHGSESKFSSDCRSPGLLGLLPFASPLRGKGAGQQVSDACGGCGGCGSCGGGNGALSEGGVYSWSGSLAGTWA